ncbi:hypothetical protein RDWZM_000893 [Blomia tropicalis]|uniref:Gustatory receptor n=1 Tax=Blomia tropicalis TaxID=40697 RepID=A0A9Q0M9R1_BLOTA|nr:hypothetical protein RDWZM_000893 [Blomia tropicalis]
MAAKVDRSEFGSFIMNRLYKQAIYSYIWYFFHKDMDKIEDTCNIKCKDHNTSVISEPWKLIETIEGQWNRMDRSKWRIHLPIFLIMFMIIRAIVVIIMHLTIPNILDYLSARHLYLYLGSPFHLLRSTTVHTEMMAIGWGCNVLIQYYFIVHNRKTKEQFLRANFLINLIVFYSDSDLRKRGGILSSSSTESNSIKVFPFINDQLLRLVRYIDLVQFRKGARIFMVGIYLFNFCMAGNVAFTTAAISYVNFRHIPLECFFVTIFWDPLWVLYTFICAIYAYYVLFYFIIYSSLLRKVMAMIRMNLEERRFNKRRPMKTIFQLMTTYNGIMKSLHEYMKLWSLYVTIILIIFNALVCFNFYLYLFTDSVYYIQMVFIATSITAFNTFICCNFYAAKIVLANESINRPLFGLLSDQKVGKQNFTNIKLIDCIGWNTAGVHYIDGTLLNMVTLNSDMKINANINGTKLEPWKLIETIDNGQWNRMGRSKWRIHLPILLIIFMIIRSTVVIIMHLTIPNVLDYFSARHWYLYFGSPFHLLHSTTVHTETTVIGWGCNVLVQYFFIVHNQKTKEKFLKANFLINLIVFYSDTDLRKRGGLLCSCHYSYINDPLIRLVNNINLNRFRNGARIFMAAVYIFNFIMAGKVTFTTLAVSYVDFRHYPYECIFIMLVWNPIWILFTFIGAIYANYVLFYFIIYSSLLRKVMSTIRMNLDERRSLKIRQINAWNPMKTIFQLMITYNGIMKSLHEYMKLWSHYVTIILILFNALVCFNFYLYLFTDALYYIRIVYLGCSITAFNIFIYCNYYAAKIVIENESINRPLFGLLSNHKVGKQTFTNIKLVDCIGWNTAGVHYIDGTLLNMVTLNSVVSYLFTTFILFINFSQNASIIDKHLE